jgi:TRAP-type C4-dicarboxylate transport system substrate-binding protein
MKSLFSTMVVCLFAIILPQSHAADQQQWNLASAYAPGNFHTKLLNEFSQEIAQKTNGKLNITVHPAASLFKAPEIKRAVQGGQIQTGEIFLANFQNENLIFGIDSVPFLVTSYEEATKLWQAQRPHLQKLLADQGMMLLYTVPWPPQGLYSKKPISSASDLRGVKFRVPSPVVGRTAQLLGAQPVTVQAAELSQAMATGIVEVVMMSGSSGVDTKIWEHMRYFYDVQAWIPKNAVIVNKRAFDALDPAIQKTVLAMGQDFERKGWNQSRQVMHDTLNTLKANGISVMPPSDTLRADFQKVGKILLGEWGKDADHSIKHIIETVGSPRP